MSKRFTATEKWGKEWYQKLKPKLKCLWQFICDNADHCGAWEPNFGLASYQIGEKVTVADLAVFGDRLAKLENGKWLVVSFIEFQYGELSEACNAHKPVFRALEKNRVSGSLLDTYLNKPRTLQEEEEEEDKEEEEVGGSAEGGVKPPKPPALEELPETQALTRLYNRRDVKRLTAKERKSLALNQPLDSEDVRLVVRYTEEQRKQPEGKDFHRRNLETLLNNWQGEVDRARQWARQNPKAAAASSQGGPARELREPPGWQDYLRSVYGAPTLPASFWGLETSLQREFREAHPELGWKGANYIGQA